MPKIILFHNPGAGSGRTQASIVALLRRAGLDPVYCNTKSRGQLAATVSQRADLVVIAGGDGTVAKVMSCRRDRSAPYLILPLGTANNIARSLGLDRVPRDLGAALRMLRPRPFHIGFVDGPSGRRHFLEAVGVGAIAEHLANGSVAASRPQEKLKRGCKALRKVIKALEPSRVRMRLDECRVDEKVLMAEFLNIARSGPGLRMGRRGCPLPFQLVRLGKPHAVPMLDWLDCLARGEEPAGPPPVSSLEGRSGQLDWHGQVLRIDDKHFPAPSEPTRLIIGREATPVFVLTPPGATRSPRHD